MRVALFSSLQPHSLENRKHSRASLGSEENVSIQDGNVLTDESEILRLKSLFVYKRRKWLERSKFKRKADFIRQWNCGVRFQDHKVTARHGGSSSGVAVSN